MILIQTAPQACVMWTSCRILNSPRGSSSRRRVRSRRKTYRRFSLLVFVRRMGRGGDRRVTTGHPCLVVKTLGTPTSVPVACCHDARDTMGRMGPAVSRVARQSLERRSVLERGDGDVTREAVVSSSESSSSREAFDRSSRAVIDLFD